MENDLNRTVCYCRQVTVGDLKQAVDDGAKSFEDVQKVTEVSTGCGCCEPEARRIVEEFLAARKK